MSQMLYLSFNISLEVVNCSMYIHFSLIKLDGNFYNNFYEPASSSQVLTFKTLVWSGGNFYDNIVYCIWNLEYLVLVFMLLIQFCDFNKWSRVSYVPPRSPVN